MEKNHRLLTSYAKALYYRPIKEGGLAMKIIKLLILTLVIATLAIVLVGCEETDEASKFMQGSWHRNGNLEYEFKGNGTGTIYWNDGDKDSIRWKVLTEDDLVSGISVQFLEVTYTDDDSVSRYTIVSLSQSRMTLLSEQGITSEYTKS